MAYVVNLAVRSYATFYSQNTLILVTFFLHPIDKDSREGGEGDKEDWIDLFVTRVEG